MSQGALQDPLTLSEALAATRIQPGHTVWLRGGVYSYDNLTCALAGTAEAPITVKPYPGEVAVIDAGFDLNGAHTLWDCDYRIVFRWSGWTGREYETSIEELNYRSFSLNAAGIQFRHAIVHDYSNIGFWLPATGGIYYGCVTYNVGELGPDRGHGHLLYTQNNTPAKLIKHNIGCNNFGWGIHAYTEGGTINNFNFIENTYFCAGTLNNPTRNFLLGGDVVADTSLWDGNCSYGGASGVQFYGNGAVGVTFQNNYVPDGIIGTVTYTLNENNVTAPPAEGGTHTRLYADDYSTERAYLTVYNWDNLNSVSVDVSSVFVPGDTLYLWSVQAGVNEAGVRQDRVAYTVAGDGTIAVDMRASEHPVAVPYQWTAPPTTFPTFGAFVVERDNA